jgi:hypothetical protein
LKILENLLYNQDTNRIKKLIKEKETKYKTRVDLNL